MKKDGAIGDVNVLKQNTNQGAGLAQWRECSLSTDVFRVQFPDSAS